MSSKRRGLNRSRTRHRVRLLLVGRDGPICHYCDNEMLFGVSGEQSSATIEHVIPHSLGGASTVDNLILACLACNHERGNSIENFCYCDFCQKAFSNWSDKRFFSLMAFNRPSVRKAVAQGEYGWGVYLGGKPVGRFHKWSDAMQFAAHYEYYDLDEYEMRGKV